jgi:peroxiredoxin
MRTLDRSLNQQLEAFRAGYLARLPPDERRAVVEAAEDLRASHDDRRVPEVGEVAPDFALPDQHGRLVRLSERLAIGPVVLLFFRGGWCPFCSLTLRAYQAALPSIEAAGGDLLAVTPVPANRCTVVAERDLLAFPVLSDEGNAVADQYGIAYELAPVLRTVYTRLGHDLPRLNKTGNWRVPLPATFIIGPDRRIVRAHVEPVAHRRLEPSEVVKTLESMPQPA